MSIGLSVFKSRRFIGFSQHDDDTGNFLIQVQLMAIAFSYVKVMSESIRMTIIGLK